MRILQSEWTGNQTSFSTNFGGKLSFILSFLVSERLHRCYIYFQYSCPCNYYSYPQTLCIKCRVSAFHPEILTKNFLTLWIPLKEGIGDECRPKDRVTLHWKTLLCHIILKSHWQIICTLNQTCMQLPLTLSTPIV
jgi:hypothetical protein